MGLKGPTSPDIIRKNLRSARISARRSMKACADLLHIPLDRYAAYESGAMVPSLPELECLSYFCKVPFSDIESAFESQIPLQVSKHFEQNLPLIISIRQKIIGAKIRSLREARQVSPAEFALKAAFSESDLEGYETGKQAIRLTILSRMLTTLGASYDDLMGELGIMSEWQAEMSEFREFSRLPEQTRIAWLPKWLTIKDNENYNRDNEDLIELGDPFTEIT